MMLIQSQVAFVLALEVQHKEAKSAGLKDSWAKTKIQLFGGLLDDTLQFVHACDQDVGHQKFNNLRSPVAGVIWPKASWIRSERIALSLSMQSDKDSNLQVTCSPCLTVWLSNKNTE